MKKININLQHRGYKICLQINQSSLISIYKFMKSIKVQNKFQGWNRNKKIK
ncbi:unnamed protein product [Paramecium pentaurelia]|uniref:Uncharacterized protein n=1 Tax=Paramecium pentaurelia TaxID=43138 RepID=A0A8S1U0S5_9CILI|nr:unnamed protein product [Paramecium pentaurelia]